MLKKAIWIVSIILLATVLYTTGLPSLKRKNHYIDDPKLSQEILFFVQNHMQEEEFILPKGGSDWQADSVKVIKIEDVAGPHKNRHATTMVFGSYIPHPEKSMVNRKQHKQKMCFFLGRKYPEGISVQYLKK